MREISFVEYLKHFFTNIDVVNNEILNTLENSLADVLLIVIGLFFIAISIVGLITNFFIKDERLENAKNNDSGFARLWLAGLFFVIGLFPIYGVMEDKVEEYNGLVKSIPDEKYVYLAYTKDFFMKDDITEAFVYMKKNTDIDTLKFYVELNSKKDSLKVKELINLMDVASNDEIVTIFEFKKILKFFNELKYTNMSTGKEIEKVKINLGININN